MNYKLYPLGECIQKKFSTTQLERIDFEMKNAIEKHIDTSVWSQMHNNSMYLMNISISDSLKNRPVLGDALDDWSNESGDFVIPRWIIDLLDCTDDVWQTITAVIPQNKLIRIRRDGADTWLT